MSEARDRATCDFLSKTATIRCVSSLGNRIRIYTETIKINSKLTIVIKTKKIRLPRNCESIIMVDRVMFG